MSNRIIQTPNLAKAIPELSLFPKNETTPNQITGGALDELKLVDANVVASRKCYDTCKKKWVGSALELVLSFLLGYYEK